MSLFPRIITRERLKRKSSARNGASTSAGKVRLPRIVHGSHGNKNPSAASSRPSPRPHTRSREQTPKESSSVSIEQQKKKRRAVAQVSIDFSEAVKMESSTLETCGRCGLAFGTASLILHQRSCRASSHGASRRTTMVRKPDQSRGEAVKKSGRELQGERMRTSTAKGNATRPGVLVRKLAAGDELLTAHRKDLVLDLPLRPRTRTLARSTLVERGLWIPTISSGCPTTAEGSDTRDAEGSRSNNEYRNAEAEERSLDAKKLTYAAENDKSEAHNNSICIAHNSSCVARGQQRLLVCQICGESVPVDKTLLHAKLCRSRQYSVSRGAIVFPSYNSTEEQGVASRREGRDGGRHIQHAHHLLQSSRKPPTVVCYICGREYGTRSISIHEPQCLKKFELENRKLPVNKRKPLPKKPISRPTQIVGVVAEITETAVSIPVASRYQEGALQDVVEQYFQHCYKEFENDRISCSTCGRKFAPERHAKHAHRCKAKPLPSTT